MKEIVERRRGRYKDCVIVLNSDEEESSALTNPIRSGDPGQGCSKDEGLQDDGDDYTTFCKLLGMD